MNAIILFLIASILLLVFVSWWLFFKNNEARWFRKFQIIEPRRWKIKKPRKPIEVRIIFFFLRVIRAFFGYLILNPFVLPVSSILSIFNMRDIDDYFLFLFFLLFIVCSGLLFFGIREVIHKIHYKLYGIRHPDLLDPMVL